MSPGLAIEQEEVAGGVMLRLAGDLTAAECIRLNERLAEAESARPGSIVLDLSQLSALDSVGLGILVSNHKRLLEAGIGFALLHPRPNVMRVFELTSLDRVLRIEPGGGTRVDEDTRASEALWEVFEFSRQLLHGLGEGLLGLDSDGRILFATASLAEMIGRREEELRGEMFDALIAGSPCGGEVAMGALMKSEPMGQRCVLLRRDGAPLEASLTWVAIERHGQRIGWLVGSRAQMATDAMRRELTASQRRLTLMVSNSNDGMVLFEPDGRLSLVNPAALEISGYESGELRSLGLLGLASESSREQWRQTWEQTLAGQSVRGRELALKRGDGSMRWVSVSGVALRDGNERLAGMLFTLRDIDEQKRSRERLRELEVSRAVGRVVGGLARDFECLVESESRQLEELNRLLADSSRGRHLVAEMRQQHAYLTEFTKNLGALGRRRPAEPRRVSLARMAESVLAEIRPRLGEAVRVSTRWPEAGAEVAVDEEDLRQIVRHVVMNALESMGDHGELRVWSELGELPEGDGGRAPHRPGGKFMRLCIEDTGPGMSREVRARAFEPFFTTKREASTGARNAGLGLSLVYGLVRQYNGWVDLESEPGRSTRVALYLPTLSAAVQGARGGGAGVEASLQPHHLLVIDDESLVLNFAAAYLERAGFAVHKAESPERALAELREHAQMLELAIVDLSLPGMSGQDLMREMRRVQPRIQFLISSGLGEYELAEAARQEGVCGALQKPYRGDELLKAVRAGLGAVKA